MATCHCFKCQEDREKLFSGEGSDDELLAIIHRLQQCECGGRGYIEFYSEYREKQSQRADKAPHEPHHLRSFYFPQIVNLREVQCALDHASESMFHSNTRCAQEAELKALQHLLNAVWYSGGCVGSDAPKPRLRSNYE